ncbi:MAG: Gfo/Idh/MocA family oxidoreductase [Pirellulales bacterium]|nr:Gfo/Idh/MocA family oxidoreductase [Pirellulales bacterium]
MTRPNGPTKKPTTTESTTDDLSRRSFLRQGSALSAAASLGIAASSARGDSVAETLNVGIVGTGGRGGGAARDTLSINPNVRLIAMADLYPEKCHSMRKKLTRRYSDRMAVTDENIFGGLDGYRHVIEHPNVDIVLLTTPPGFRPSYLKEAVDAGKHVFAEKPTCVDPAGYRVCLEADRKARAQGTAIVTGTQYRRQKNYMEVMRRIHEGAIGDVISATSRYCTSGIWNRPRKPGMSDAEYQLYNWMHFIWLSGDQIVEQAVHNIDAMNWLMGGPPDTAYGSGGRFTRPKGSQMWDSVAIDYAYPGDRLLSFQCRQIPHTQGENGSIVYGSEGIAIIGAANKGASITDRAGKEIWSMKGDINAAYRQEHKDLVDSISAGKPIVELAETAASSLTAVMGRLAAYTGEQVDWDFVAQQSTLDLFPKELKIDESLPIASYAVPGVTKLT